MTEHLDTAPLWDAYRAGGECPLCDLESQNEAAYVETFLGGSVMEPAVRMEVNQKGFCEKHMGRLYAAGNRLGLALMADTRLKEVIARVRAASAAAPDRGGFWKKHAPAPDFVGGCVLCERLENTMTRYAATLCWLWGGDEAFKALFAASKGFCVKHYAAVRGAAPGELTGKNLERFLQKLDEVEIENLERVEKDLDGFTQKFDYRNRDKPWGESRDALPRAVNKLRGGALSLNEKA